MKPWGRVILSPWKEECSRHASPCKARRIDANSYTLECDCGCTAHVSRENPESYTSVSWERVGMTSNERNAE